jgi:hypothetical protein
VVFFSSKSLMAELPPRLKVPNKDAKLIIAFAS